jgi:hypothetical protein
MKINNKGIVLAKYVIDRQSVIDFVRGTQGATFDIISGL